MTLHDAIRTALSRQVTLHADDLTVERDSPYWRIVHTPTGRHESGFRHRREAEQAAGDAVGKVVTVPPDPAQIDAVEGAVAAHVDDELSALRGDVEHEARLRRRAAAELTEVRAVLAELSALMLPHLSGSVLHVDPDTLDGRVVLALDPSAAPVVGAALRQEGGL